MRILVLGASGLLGSNVFTAVAESGGEPVGTYRTREPPYDPPCHELDIRDKSSSADLLEETDPDLVVNCAAMTDVDGCEANPQRASEVNGGAPGTFAALCADRDVAFTHVSTDYVFDGRADSPYETTAAPNPIQEYGRSKLAGERAVSENHPDPTVVRLSFVYGIHRGTGKLEGFPAWVGDRLRGGESTPLFVDQQVTPTRAGQAAETILELHETASTGLYHVSCKSCVTPYEFGDRIRRLMDVSAEYIEEGTTGDVDRPADRPRYTCLDVSDVEEDLDRFQPSLADDLAAIEPAFD